MLSEILVLVTLTALVKTEQDGVKCPVPFFADNYLFQRQYRYPFLEAGSNHLESMQFVKINVPCITGEQQCRGYQSLSIVNNKYFCCDNGFNIQWSNPANNEQSTPTCACNRQFYETDCVEGQAQCQNATSFISDGHSIKCCHLGYSMNSVSNSFINNVKVDYCKCTRYLGNSVVSVGGVVRPMTEAEKTQFTHEMGKMSQTLQTEMNQMQRTLSESLGMFGRQFGQGLVRRIGGTVRQSLNNVANRFLVPAISQTPRRHRLPLDSTPKTVTTEGNSQRPSSHEQAAANANRSTRTAISQTLRRQWLPLDSTPKTVTTEGNSQSASSNEQAAVNANGSTSFTDDLEDESWQPRRHQLTLGNFFRKSVEAEKYKENEPKLLSGDHNGAHRQQTLAPGRRDEERTPVTNNKENDKQDARDNTTLKRLSVLETFQLKEHNSQNTNNQKPINVKVLASWAGMEDSNQLVLLISAQLKQLQIFLNQQRLQEQCLLSLIQAVSLALKAPQKDEVKRQMLNSLCVSKFFEHLTMYATEKQLQHDEWYEADEFFVCCMEILEAILNMLPECAKACMSVLSALVDTAQSIEGLLENTNVLPRVTALHEQSKKVFLQGKKAENSRRLMATNFDNPPDDFVHLPIIPTEFDLQDVNPFIRHARVEGGYQNVHEYLDVQFRLMRQDFIIPLREGIEEFKKNHCKQNIKSSNLKFYFNVRIVGTEFDVGIKHVVQLDNKKNFHWTNSKRLMFGSLLCFSKDNFETVVFATVACDISKMVKGTILVNFRTGLDNIFCSTPNDVYIMAETTAYFESYYHVLEGLQEMVSKLPLEDYIIHCKTEVRPPRYLLPSGGVLQLPLYNLSALMNNKSTSQVPVLTTVKWPKADLMCLNDSQREAAQQALTKELAIIQGPPGTGKTYVGLKVMQVLLENANIMGRTANGGHSPILVVCYTNHALDQFLEGVLKFCPDGIVRVGGMSKSEKLSQFNLRNLKGHIFDRSFENNIKNIAQKLQHLSETIHLLHMDVVEEHYLSKHMKPVHKKSLLHDRNRSPHGQTINTWLGVSSHSTESLLSKMIKQHLTLLVLNMKYKPGQVQFSPGMNIIDRALYYHCLLKEYERELINEMQGLSTLPFYTSNNKRIQYWLQAARKQILPDHQLWAFLTKGFLEKMRQYSGNWTSGRSDNVIENWLLRPDRSIHEQLDDVEMLTNIHRPATDDDDGDILCPDDMFTKEQNDRRVDDDHFHYDKVKARIRNLTSALKRAEALGIREDVVVEGSVDNDEWKMVSRNKLTLRALHRKLQSIKPMTEEEEMKVMSVWDLEVDKRFALYNLWVQRYRVNLIDEMKELVQEYESVQKQRKNSDNQETLKVLHRAEVIGMTTSGAAMHRAVLQDLGCRIIVVEEAAEVLEAHIVTSLNKNCQHLILIGDHQQLRPNPTVYQLAKDFGLEVSLFERLIKNKVPHVMLKEQHRMRPEISQIMRHIYPDLHDHDSVAHFEDIRGVSKNIFFIQHEHAETHLEDTMSKSNTHEAKFLVALCQYLLNQDYKASQITILATYAGQVTEIRRVMKKHNLDDSILVTAVDNYQGEENDIILLSLVRSNVENKVGFLKVDNRVCVALSRAKKGLYAIGNLKLLAASSKLWKKIFTTARLENIIGSGLPVSCYNHPDFHEVMISDTDFQKCPEGGCGRPCLFRLQCGHVCNKTCHGYDHDHTAYKCHKPCAKTCDQGHPCQLKCYEECFCSVLVLKQIPSCGHEDQVQCSVLADEAVCSLNCTEVLNCEHQCTGVCGECKNRNQHEICKVQVTHQWLCGHSNVVPCHTTKSKYGCKEVCEEVLDCGHACSGICGECWEKGHADCRAQVKHTRSCGHIEDILCYQVKCLQVCKNVCGSNLDCGHTCSGKCGLCMMHKKHDMCRAKCGAVLHCGHICKGTCSSCLEGAVHVACQEKCVLSLPCGHACHGFCGTPCLPCKQKCPNRCRHGACGQAKAPPLCGHMCPPCNTMCSYQCKHLAYRKLCSDNLDTQVCTEKCTQKLPCKHKCVAPCGEFCVCRKCSKVIEIPQAAVTSTGNGEAGSTGSTTGKQDVTKMTVKGDSKQKSEQHTSNKHHNQLLLKLPSCSHIFYVDELDRYISHFDPRGTSYIPCPLCQTPIVGCIRYENINRERSKKRAILKEKLQRRTMIMEQQEMHIQRLQISLLTSPLADHFSFIDDIDVWNIRDCDLWRAMSFQLKCVAVLDKIRLIVDKHYITKSFAPMESRIQAVNNIQGRLTNQQQEEFTIELQRFFWLCSLSYLNSVCVSDSGRDSGDQEIDAELRQTIEVLDNLKPAQDVLTKAQLVFDRMKERIQGRSMAVDDVIKFISSYRSSLEELKTLTATEEDVQPTSGKTENTNNWQSLATSTTSRHREQPTSGKTENTDSGQSLATPITNRHREQPMSSKTENTDSTQSLETPTTSRHRQQPMSGKKGRSTRTKTHFSKQRFHDDLSNADRGQDLQTVEPKQLINTDSKPHQWQQSNPNNRQHLATSKTSRHRVKPMSGKTENTDSTQSLATPTTSRHREQPMSGKTENTDSTQSLATPTTSRHREQPVSRKIQNTDSTQSLATPTTNRHREQQVSRKKSSTRKQTYFPKQRFNNDLPNVGSGQHLQTMEPQQLINTDSKPHQWQVSSPNNRQHLATSKRSRHRVKPASGKTENTDSTQESGNPDNKQTQRATSVSQKKLHKKANLFP